MFLSQEIDRKTISNLYKNSFICSRTLTNESAIYWSRVSVCMTGLVYCTSIGGSFDTDFYIILSIISIKNKNKNYKIIFEETLRFLWDIFVFRLVAYLLNMICLNLLFLNKIVYI